MKILARHRNIFFLDLCINYNSHNLMRVLAESVFNSDTAHEKTDPVYVRLCIYLPQ